MLETDILLKGPENLLRMRFGIWREKGTNEQRASISTNKVSVLQFQVCEHQEHRSQSNLLTAWRLTLKYL